MTNRTGSARIRHDVSVRLVLRLSPLAIAGLALASVVAGVGAATGRGAPPTGLHGVVRKGPITPVCRTGVPCDAPAAKLTLTFRREGAAPVRVRTNDMGEYRILVPASIYSVSLDGNTWPRSAPYPARVKIRAGHLDRIDFSIDTGIR